jgi:FkbM family methyltransferase
MDQVQRLGDIVSAYREHFGDVATVIVDAGTRDGDDAAWLAGELQASKVIAIDANPAAVRDTRQSYPSFTVVESALADYDGVADFTRIISERKDFAGSSSLKMFEDFGEPTETYAVAVSRMDTLLFALGFDEPFLDVVKVDVEGFTYEFLIGLGEWLGRVKVFHLETEKFHRHFGHYDSEAVSDLMVASGFDLVSVSYEWGPKIEDQVWVNNSFFNRKMY